MKSINLNVIVYILEVISFALFLNMNFLFLEVRIECNHFQIFKNPIASTNQIIAPDFSIVNYKMERNYNVLNKFKFVLLVSFHKKTRVHYDEKKQKDKLLI